MEEDKEKVRVCKYWRLILCESWYRAMEKSKMKGAFISVVVALLIVGILIIIYLCGILPTSWNIVISDSISDLRLKTLYFILLAAVFLIILLASMIHMPAKLHEEQQIKLDNQEKIIHPDVNLKLTSYHPEAGANGVRWAGVNIHNNSGKYAIKNCKAKLLEFSPKVRGVDNLPSVLQWSANNRPDPDGSLVISRDGDVTLDIAVSYENYIGGTITLVRGAHFIKFLPGKHKIKFRIDGTLGSNDIEPQIYSAKIVLEEGVDIKIKDIRHVKTKRKRES